MLRLWGGCVGLAVVSFGAPQAQAVGVQEPLEEESLALGVGQEWRRQETPRPWVVLTTDGQERNVAVGLHGHWSPVDARGAATLVAGFGSSGTTRRVALGAWAQAGHDGDLRGAGGPWARVELRPGAENLAVGRSLGDDLRGFELRLDLQAGGGALTGGPGWAGLGRAVASVGSPARRVGVQVELPVGGAAVAPAWIRPSSPMAGLMVEVRRGAGR